MQLPFRQHLSPRSPVSTEKQSGLTLLTSPGSAGKAAAATASSSSAAAAASLSVHEQLELTLRQQGDACSLSTVKSIIARDRKAVNLQAPDTGDTLLHIACAHGASLAVIKYLVAKCPSALELGNQQQLTPIDVALYHSHASSHRSYVEVIKYLDQESPWMLKFRNMAPTNALHLACKHGGGSGSGGANLEVIQYLLKQNKDLIATTDERHNTPLHLLCKNMRSSSGSSGSNNNNTNSHQHLGDASLKAILHATKAFPGALVISNRDHETPLHILCKQHNPNIPLIKLLIQLCPRSLEIGERSYNLPLHILCKQGGPLELIKFMHQICPRALHTRNFYKETPLHTACTYGGSSSSLSVILFLVNTLPRALEWTNCNCETPLHLVCKQRHPRLDVVQYLVHKFPAACLFSYFSTDIPLHWIKQVKDTQGNLVPNPVREFMQQATHDAAVALLEAFRVARSQVPKRMLEPVGLMKLFDKSDNEEADRDKDDDEVKFGSHQQTLQQSIDCIISLNSDYTNKEKIRLLQWKSELGAWIRKKRHYVLVGGIFHMNRAGRSYFQDDAGNKNMGVKVLLSVIDNLNCLYIHLRENPVLCDRTVRVNVG